MPAAVVPVAVGTAIAHLDGGIVWWRAGLALLVSLALQIGVNFANDYSDGIRGTDEHRVGPLRLVGSGLVPARQVKWAAFGMFAVAALAGLLLAIVTTPWLIAVGLLAILAGWFYTGGAHPYGYLGLGEVFVFVFFGVVAVVGTTYVQIERLPALAWWSSVPVGLLAVALLVVNNLRDIPGDRQAGKRTLAVRLGDPKTRTFYALIVCASFAMLAVVCVSAGSAFPLLAAVSVLLAVAPIGIVRGGALGPALIPALVKTAKLHLWFGALLTIGLVLVGV